MKNIKPYLFLSLFLLISALSSCNNQVIADTVFYAKIYDGEHFATRYEALAIKGDQIVFVDKKEDVKPYIGSNTNVIDRSDNLILPGTTDAHCHMYLDQEVEGLKDTMPILDLMPDPTSQSDDPRKDCMDKIQAFVTANPNLDFYYGMGWTYDLFSKNPQTLKDLDDICSDKPIYLKGHDCHSCWVNTKMLDRCGITSSIEDEEGGYVGRDNSLNLTGVFYDTCYEDYIRPFVPKHSVEDYKKIILKAQEKYAAYGYTAYIDIFIEDDESNENLCKAYEELDKANKLKLRVQAAWVVNNKANYETLINKIANYKNSTKGGMFELTDIKIFVDGVTEIGTALLIDPYATTFDPGGVFKGWGRWDAVASKARLPKVVEYANRKGLVVHMHCIGDQAVRQGLNAIETAQSHYKSNQFKNVLTHCMLVNPDDFQKFHDLDLILNANLEWGCKLEPNYTAVDVHTLGPERAEHSYPYRSIYDKGVTLSFATDMPAGGTGYAACAYFVATHRSLGTEDTVRDATQIFTNEEAIKIFINGGAKEMRQDNIRGILKPGMKADFTIVKDDFLDHEFTYDDLINCDVIYSYVNGKAVYKPESL